MALANSPAARRNGSSLERRIHDGERPPARDVADAGQAEHGAQPLGRHVLDRPRTGRLAWRRLGEGGRSRRVEGDVSLDLPEDLVDVAVQHGDRAEPLEVAERLLTVLGAP